MGLWFASALAGYLCVKLVHAIEWAWHRFQAQTPLANAVCKFFRSLPIQGLGQLSLTRIRAAGSVNKDLWRKLAHGIGYKLPPLRG